MTDVTVCIPSIPPRAPLLQRAITSVLAQERPADALSIAIDNHKQGAAMTRNRALFAVKTEWVAFLDDDDEMYQRHLRRLFEHQELTGADVVFPWFDVIGGLDPFPVLEGLEFKPETPHSFPITTLVRTQLALEVGGFPVERDPQNTVGAGEDWYFWLKLIEAGAHIVHLNERTWCWHHDSGNTGGLPKW